MHTSYSIGASSTTATMVIHIAFLSLSLPFPPPLSLSLFLPLSLLVCLSVSFHPASSLSGLLPVTTSGLANRPRINFGGFLKHQYLSNVSHFHHTSSQLQSMQCLLNVNAY